jgi:hypothetical protein
LAARHRKGKDASVPAPALEAAWEVLAATAGSRVMDDASARITALRIIEDACAPIDPRPMLGASMNPETFRKRYVARGGAPRPAPELLP